MLDTWSYFAFSIPSTPALPAGDYTYEVTTADGSLLTTTVAFQGDMVVPVPAAPAMTHRWLPDGSLKLTWQNSTGDYSTIRVRGRDENWNDLFTIAAPTSATTVTLPKWALDEIEATYGAVPTQAYWWVEWRLTGVKHIRQIREKTAGASLAAFKVYTNADAMECWVTRADQAYFICFNIYQMALT
jgi:hypothetical protein